MEDTNRGSLTIEAAIVVPIFLFVILSIMSLMKLVIAHEIIQHSISESANQLAGYTYLLNATGLKEKYDKEQEKLISQKKPIDNIIENAGKLKNQAENLENSLRIAGKAFEDITGDSSSLQSAPENINKAKIIFEEMLAARGSVTIGTDITKQLGGNINDVRKNPKSIIAFITYEGIEKGMSLGLGFYTKKMMEYIYLDCEPNNDPLEKLGVIGGVDGLEFDKSKLFSPENNGVKGNEDIDIVVNYKFNPKMPIPVITEIDVVQRAVIRAWMDGGE